MDRQKIKMIFAMILTIIFAVSISNRSYATGAGIKGGEIRNKKRKFSLQF